MSGISQQGLWFSTWAVHVRFTVNKMAVAQLFNLENSFSTNAIVDRSFVFLSDRSLLCP